MIAALRKAKPGSRPAVDVMSMEVVLLVWPEGEEPAEVAVVEPEGAVEEVTCEG